MSDEENDESFSLNSLRVTLPSSSKSDKLSSSISTCGGKVRLLSGVPSSNFFLLENRIAINLWLSFAVAAVAGQRIVDSLSWSDIFLKFGTTRLNLLKKHSLFIANVPQCNKKWASLSTDPSEQYLQVLSIV